MILSKGIFKLNGTEFKTADGLFGLSFVKGFKPLNRAEDFNGDTVVISTNDAIVRTDVWCEVDSTDGALLADLAKGDTVVCEFNTGAETITFEAVVAKVGYAKISKSQYGDEGEYLGEVIHNIVSVQLTPSNEVTLA